MKNNNAKQVNNSDVHYSTEEVVIMNTTIMPKLLSAKEVADILKIGYVKALELMRYGKIPSVKLGNTYRTSEEALADWLRTSIGK
ncbi:dNA binding domain protein excisionase family [Ruminococcus sp. CAG:624]|nr:dNA binding domain protein excisionase family [Ruminococcus sp. CAG:624]